MCGNYSREETIQGRKLYEEIRYVKFARWSDSNQDICKYEMFSTTLGFGQNFRWHLVIPGFPRVTILLACAVRMLVHCVLKHCRPPDLKSFSNISLPFAWITGPHKRTQLSYECIQIFLIMLKWLTEFFFSICYHNEHLYIVHTCHVMENIPNKFFCDEHVWESYNRGCFASKGIKVNYRISLINVLPWIMSPLK